MKYTATIIEDEIPARITLKSYLAKYFESIEVIAEIDNTQESIDFLNQNHCDILFIDVQLKDGKAIEILNKIDTSKHKIVFTTAHDDYTLEAFKHKAFGYLLKPLDPKDFKEIVGRILIDLTYQDSSQKEV
jgi:two-component system LytT family response regulator